jgi:hypothetical protein
MNTSTDRMFGVTVILASLGIIMRRRWVGGAFVAGMLAASPALALTPQEEIQTIAAWAKQVGHSAAPLRGDVANIMGLGTGLNNSPFCVSYGNPVGPIDYLFCLFPRRPEFLIVRADAQISIFWLVKDGDIAKTIFTDPTHLLVLPNNQYRDVWVQLKDAFLSKATGTGSTTPKE